MCQKASGSFFAPWTGVALDQFEVTRGTLATFNSSDPVERGFCRDCGTPLTFRYLHGPGRISVSIGSLDDPERAKPLEQLSTESRLSWFSDLASLPSRTTGEWSAGHEDWMAEIARTNQQHPDHETAVWPLEHRS